MGDSRHSVLIYYVSSGTLSEVLRLCLPQFCIVFHTVNPREKACFYPRWDECPKKQNQSLYDFKFQGHTPFL